MWPPVRNRCSRKRDLALAGHLLPEKSKQWVVIRLQLSLQSFLCPHMLWSFSMLPGRFQKYISVDWIVEDQQKKWIHMNDNLLHSSASRQFSPDPLTNALGIGIINIHMKSLQIHNFWSPGFMTVAMIDGIHKIQVSTNSGITILITVIVVIVY